MKKQNLLGLMLATTVALSALAGCKAPMMTTAPGGSNTGATQPAGGGSMTTTQPAAGGKLAPAKQAAATENSQATAEAMNDEQDMNAYDAMANEAPAAYNVLLVGAPKPAEGMVGITGAIDAEAGVTIGGKGGKRALNDKQKQALERLSKAKELKADVKKKVKERQEKQKDALKGRLDKLKDARVKMHGAFGKAAWVAGEVAGTEQKTVSFETTKTVNGKTNARTVEMIRVRNAETKQELSFHVAFTQALPSGLARTSTRDRVLQEDGSYLVTFHSELTLPNGTARTADWTKTIAADGTVSGTGTINWVKADGTTKTITVTFSGKEEAEKAKCTDGETKTEAEVAVTADGGTTAVATDTTANTTAPIEVSTETEVTTTTTTTETTTTADTTQGIAVGEPNGDAAAGAMLPVSEREDDDAEDADDDAADTDDDTDDTNAAN